MAKNNNLNDFFTDIADAIREKLPSQSGNAQTAEQYDELLTEKTRYGLDPTSHIKTILNKNDRYIFNKMKDTNNNPYLLHVDTYPYVPSTSDITLTQVIAFTASDFDTLAKFNAVLSTKIGWTVTQTIYDYLYENLFSLPWKYKNIVVFGTNRGGIAQDLWFIYNYTYGERFTLDEIGFLKDASAGISIKNNSSISLSVGRMYGYGSGNTVVNNNPGFEQGRNLLPDRTFTTSPMNVAGNDYVGTSYQAATHPTVNVAASANISSGTIIQLKWYYLKNGKWGDSDLGNESMIDPGSSTDILDMIDDGNPFTNEITIIQKYSPTQFADLIRSI